MMSTAPVDEGVSGRLEDRAAIAVIIIIIIIRDRFHGVPRFATAAAGQTLGDNRLLHSRGMSPRGSCLSQLIWNRREIVIERL